ncbi:MAG TPA: GHKL domain-containing protein, partial [Bacteroidetes bacterium]|nr:GHKL domain-containing protein [Bacteroidota bacterium]
KSYIRTMEEEIDRIRKITNGFLKFVRLEKLDFMPVNANEVIQRVCFTIQQGLPPEIELNMNLNFKIPSISADEDQIVILLENILDNAVKAIEDSGKITVTTDTIQEWDEFNQNFNASVVIEIADTGIGMTDEMLDSIFQPFFTTRKEGVGLGLMIVKEIVKAHDGKVRVRSKRNIGTQISLNFPVR